MDQLRGIDCKEKGRNTIETRTGINGVVKDMTLGFWEIEKFHELESRRIEVKNYKYVMRGPEERLHFWEEEYELDRTFLLGKLIMWRNYYIQEKNIMKHNTS